VPEAPRCYGSPASRARNRWIRSSRTGANGNGSLYRIAGGRVVRRLRVDAETLPMIAPADDGVRVAGPRGRDRYAAVRLDPRTGRATAAVDLGRGRPVSLTAAGRRLCVVTGGADAVFIGS